MAGMSGLTGMVTHYPNPHYHLIFLYCTSTIVRYVQFVPLNFDALHSEKTFEGMGLATKLHTTYVVFVIRYLTQLWGNSKASYVHRKLLSDHT